MERPFYDQFSDPSYRTVFRLLQENPHVEPFVKTAGMDAKENTKIADSAFAWPERRLFRIDTPAHAVLSKLFMEKQAGIPEPVKERCNRALEIFGIDPGQVKVASAPTPVDENEYLLPTERRLRVRNAEDMKLAADAIDRNLKNMDVRTRAYVCTNLVKKALELETPAPTWALKFAGYTMCDTQKLRDWIYARAEAVTDPQLKYAYERLADGIKDAPRLYNNRDELIKMAEALSELDEAGELNKRYDRSLLDPLSTVFNTDKVADEMLELAGKPVPMETLLSISPETYKDAFGDDIVSEFVDTSTGEIDPDKLRVILPTVPRDLQRALAAQLGI